MSKEKLSAEAHRKRIIDLLNAVRHTTNDIEKVADEICSVTEQLQREREGMKALIIEQLKEDAKKGLKALVQLEKIKGCEGCNPHALHCAHPGECGVWDDLDFYEKKLKELTPKTEK